MCSGSEAGSYLRLIDFVYHSTLGLRVMKKKRVHQCGSGAREREGRGVEDQTANAFHVQGSWFEVQIQVGDTHTHTHTHTYTHTHTGD